LPIEDLVTKLYALADKYVQEDLREKCMEFFKHIISPDNVYKILDFSRQENLSAIKSWCLNFLKNKIDGSSIYGLVDYVNKQSNPEYAQENLELRYKGLSVIVDNYFALSNDQIYEDFLINSINTETVGGLAKFLYGQNIKIDPCQSAKMNIENEIEKERERLKPVTVNLKPAVLGFVQKNLKTLHESKITKDIPHSLFVDLLLYGTEKPKSPSQ